DVDLVLANRDGQGNKVYLNNGQLGFDIGVPFGTGRDETRSVAVADFNGDGRPDIATANIGEPNYIYFNSGDPSFKESVKFDASSSNSFSITAIDLDFDGDQDLVVANAGVKMQFT
ncbi:MAG: VCBS repeat-containing protein, partial [Flavobacteriales bacterium]|nr:VCBS repeat-containing protein [Flavobacteriales bacterium]